LYIKMSSSPGTAERLSEFDRGLLRESVREFLLRGWPADSAVDRANDRQAIASLWRNMASEDLTSLGAKGGETGLREVVLVFEELGRAGCPAPLLGAVAANLALAGPQTNAITAVMDDLHRGEAALALALGALDGDKAAGRVEARGNELTGRISFVEGAQAATHFLVLTDKPAGAAIVANGAPGLTVRETPGLAVPAFAELTFENTPATLVELSPDALVDIATVARLCCLARALGAAQRAFDLAVEHAKIRKQFGQLVGQFQAVQHKLANNLIALDGARLTLESAADARDSGDPDWRVFAAAAFAFAGPALREVSIQTHRAFGAIGYAEEHEAPRHFRRVHADLARFGGTPRARAELADYLFGPAS
jgi:alkylation response protein AidB-like acyl-CoA dehydrogenase